MPWPGYCRVMPTVPLLLHLPGEGRWQARNSPARRVPSHGSHLFGTTYAIDLVPVDDRGRSGPVSWRTVLATEDPVRFVGFGRTVTAPLAGRVVFTHDGESDGVVRRSPVAFLGHLREQTERARRGLPGLAGNCVVIEVEPEGPYVLVAHLRCGSVAVRPDDVVMPGAPIGECGNSGNSTQPHVHLQVTDSLDWQTTRGLPLAFHAYRGRRGDVIGQGLPDEGEVVEAID